MKFTLLASAFAVSSVLAGRGPKDTNKPNVVTVYRTETTHKYGRFNKTPHPTTTTVVVSPEEYSSIKQASIQSSASAADVVRVQIERRAENGTAGAASNGTAAGGASNGTAAGGASNSTGGGSSANAGVATSGATFGVAGVIAVGCALLI
ncbi:hypothetical protein PVL30_004677 [Lodderomyces elongisporus]|uniref:Uncharacterized protein n=1 Tax=Lodderomyces elongisporus (strain ATCC 11503 / CBS 2605 / JCM 1781 / NBRC 1676 / NRRL YB-4239) TaxID=379508 RepID=A5E2L5_LODEL|nr:uncharacterized protein PVL30_004677 [Lodderomyces elongisporus]EDK45673.1 predicted protein [Lodderomyces elongisporus NRRL YB-4239]WLF80884.1 hypothetical protein PVL30_004677 [Lodderomyces elongisporus]